MSTPTARQRRLYRAQAATYLASLNSSCSVEDLLTIDWVALETLPHWCFLPPEQSRVLKLLCGAIFYAPMIQRFIDGQRIQALVEVIGRDGYQGVLAYSSPSGETFESLAAIETPALEAALLQAGEAVTLGAIEHDIIARLIQEQIQDGKALAAEIAIPIYSYALTLFDSMNSAPESTETATETELPESKTSTSEPADQPPVAESQQS